MPLKLKRQDKGLTPTSIDQGSSIHGLIPRYFCFLDTYLDSRSIDRVIKSQTIKVWECFLFWGGGGGGQNLLDNGFEVSQTVSKIKMLLELKLTNVSL